MSSSGDAGQGDGLWALNLGRSGIVVGSSSHPANVPLWRNLTDGLSTMHIWLTSCWLKAGKAGSGKKYSLPSKRLQYTWNERPMLEKQALQATWDILKLERERPSGSIPADGPC